MSLEAYRRLFYKGAASYLKDRDTVPPAAALFDPGRSNDAALSLLVKL
jgi:hypothetical protein